MSQPWSPGWLLPQHGTSGSRLLILGGEPLVGESPRPACGTALPTVIRLPAEIDATNAGRIGEELGSAFATGVAVVIADMTATTFCDASGARELLLAHHKATEDAIELQIVMPPSANIRRLFQLTGLDQVLAIYPSLAAVSADDIALLMLRRQPSGTP